MFIATISSWALKIPKGLYVECGKHIIPSGFIEFAQFKTINMQSLRDFSNRKLLYVNNVYKKLNYLGVNVVVLIQIWSWDCCWFFGWYLG